MNYRLTIAAMAAAATFGFSAAHAQSLDVGARAGVQAGPVSANQGAAIGVKNGRQPSVTGAVGSVTGAASGVVDTATKAPGVKAGASGSAAAGVNAKH